MCGMSDRQDATDLKRQLDAMVREFVELREFKDALLGQQPFKPGDRAALTRSFADPSSGWWYKREVLVEGNTGTVTSVDFSAHHGKWYAMWKPDIEWSVSDWNGLRHIGERKPDDKRHVFMMWLDDLRAATDDDAPVPFPGDAEGKS